MQTPIPLHATKFYLQHNASPLRYCTLHQRIYRAGNITIILSTHRTRYYTKNYNFAAI